MKDILKEHYRKIGSKGGYAKAKKMTEKEKSENGRKMALARYAKKKALSPTEVA